MRNSFDELNFYLIFQLFQLSIHILFFYNYSQRLCALTSCILHYYIYLIIAFAIFTKFYTSWLIWQKRKRKRNKRCKRHLNKNLHYLSNKCVCKISTLFIEYACVKTLHCLLSELTRSPKNWIVSKTFL